MAPPPAPRALAAPAALVLLSSAGLAAATLVLTPEASWNTWMWPARDAVQAALAAGPLAGLLASTPAQAALFLALLAPGLAGALLGARRLGDGRGALAAVLAVGALAALPQLLVRPFWSNDVLLYELHARIAVVYGESPYVTPGTALPRTCAAPGPHGAYARCEAPADCPGRAPCLPDLYVNLSPWASQPTPYGPLAFGIARAAYTPALDPFENSVVLRLLAALAALGAAWVAGRAAGDGAAALLAWSPVAWLEAANAGHVEAFVALALAALGAHLLRAGPRLPEAAGVAVAAAALVKIPALLVLPPAMAVGRRAGRAARVAAVALGLVALGYALVWAAPHPFGGLLVESAKTDKSLVHALALGLEAALGADPRPVLAPLLGALLLAWLLRRTLDVATGADAVALMAAAWLAAVCFVVGRFHPWHALPPLALAALLPAGEPARRGILTLATLAPALVYGRFLLARDYGAATTVPMALALFGAVLAAWAGGRRRPRSA